MLKEKKEKEGDNTDEKEEDHEKYDGVGEVEKSGKIGMKTKTDKSK